MKWSPSSRLKVAPPLEFSHLTSPERLRGEESGGTSLAQLQTLGVGAEQLLQVPQGQSHWPRPRFPWMQYWVLEEREDCEYKPETHLPQASSDFREPAILICYHLTRRVHGNRCSPPLCHRPLCTLACLDSRVWWQQPA